MPYRLRTLSLATATLLLSLTYPALPLDSTLSPLVTQAQTVQDKKAEAIRLNQEGLQQLSRGQFREALVTFQEALVIAREIEQRQAEGVFLNNIGQAYDGLGQYQKALEYYQQALSILREVNDRREEGTTLNNIGSVYWKLKQYQTALEYYQQALPIVREVGNRRIEAYVLNNIGTVYKGLGQYQRALEYQQQALPIVREVGDRLMEGTILNNMGRNYNALGQYQTALEYHQQALEIRRSLGVRFREGKTLYDTGEVYNNWGQFQTALEYYQQALTIFQQVGNPPDLGETFHKIGDIYYTLGQYDKALESHQQALVISRELSDKAMESKILNNMGFIYSDLGQYTKSLEFYQQALAIAREIGEKLGEGTILDNIGSIYHYQGQYGKALEFFQQALTLRQDIEDVAGKGVTLNNIGDVHRNLGQYSQALELYQQALAISQDIEDTAGEGITLSNIGAVYYHQNQYTKALEFFEKALTISRELGDKAATGKNLNNIGEVYRNLEQYPKALEFYQQTLVLSQELGDRAVEGVTLGNIGLVYLNLKEYTKALEYFQPALAIAKEIGNQAGEITILNNMGFLFNEQDQPELAIIFYKQSVNVTEAIRKDLQTLPQDQQQSYTETVADTYRHLADLLLQQNRILEAQRVLDLLKIQELDDYLNNVRGNEETAQGIETLPPEQQILAEYNQLQDEAIELGKELAKLRQTPEAEWTPAQEQHIAELVAKQGQLKRLFIEFIQRPDVVALVNQLSQTAKEQSLQLSRLTNISDNLRNLEQNAVLLYPLILEDRLELILASPDSPPIRRTVQVTREELNQTIVEFRQALENPRNDAVTPARQLYEWLIKPLENDLTTANAQTIIYAPDGQLRYIPLAALYDGNNWLVQRFRINNITADSLTDFDNRRSAGTSLRVLAGAFTQGSYSFAVGDEQFTFAGLPFAGREVEILAEAVPETTKLIDEEFSKTAILPRMDNHSIVHFATHGALVKGLPEESFILLGNGDRISMREVQNTWFLTNVDLIVLSACETGLGGQFGTGEEILGFGYLMQNAGARAAIASLWQVSDGGTQALMNAFYAALQGDNITKAEALRQAQIALITGDYTALGEERGSLIVEFIGDTLPKSVQERLSHPYYWAPFILIGNGL